MIQEELFSEKRNLVYILVTDRCNVGCDFCMCNKKRNGDHMILYPQSLENLSRLTSDSYKIGISGQGEPLLNKEAIMQILNLPGRERQFDLITSGNFPEKELTNTLYEIDDIISKHRDYCKIRLSLDRFHLLKVNYKNFLPLIDFFINKKREESNLVLSFRSITIDTELIYEYISTQLERKGYTAKWKKINPLKYEFETNGSSFVLEFQSIVNSSDIRVKDRYTTEQYISLLEKRLRKPFTLGNLLNHGKPGIDITINPNGDVVFYGLECENIGNIHTDFLTQTTVLNFISENELYSSFILIPFKEILAELRKDSVLSEAIDIVNNPYWIVRNLYSRYKTRLLRRVKALRRRVE